MSIVTRRKAWSAGFQAEEHAALWLGENCGYDILERRYKTPYGEIDLLAQKDSIVIIVEVKQRATIDQALQALSKRQWHRLQQAALFFLSANNLSLETSLQFDLCIQDVYGTLEHKPHIAHDFGF